MQSAFAFLFGDMYMTSMFPFQVVSALTSGEVRKLKLLSLVVWFAFSFVRWFRLGHRSVD